MASTFLLLPNPCGSTTVPRTIWSACFGSTPRRAVNSTVSSNFAYLTFWSRGIASSIVKGCGGTCFLAASNFLPKSVSLWSKRVGDFADSPTVAVTHGFRLLHYIQPHRPRGAGDCLDGCFERVAVQIGQLHLRDVFHL